MGEGRAAGVDGGVFVAEDVGSVGVCGHEEVDGQLIHCGGGVGRDRKRGEMEEVIEAGKDVLVIEFVMLSRVVG